MKESRGTLTRVSVFLGLLAGAALPFYTRNPSSLPLTDVEAHVRHVDLSVLLFAGYGALCGWAVGVLITHFTRKP